ncbi:MAG: transglycosylase SLT domain-containing protein [Saprospiraceae bacterium]|nr:transglycosylase SLT domain-containing protein [Saprospiraceae bacterium]
MFSFRYRLLVSCLTLLLTTSHFAVQSQDIAVEELPVNAEAAVLPLIPTDTELLERLDALSSSCMPMRITSTVRAYIQTYVVKKPEKASIMLGKRLTYFPMFEQKLQEHGLPTDLKYLAVVESALNPRAVSRAGAVGLWQFMPGTGNEYGLYLTKAVDERVDPVKSTEAAVKYLKNLYRHYNDWALALAAYNSGPGRVNAAIRRARSRNFWRIQAFLPRETRNYVPAFIAATYICNYHLLHGLEPQFPDRDEQLTAYLKVFETLTFHDIANATGVDLNVIQNLNPGYRNEYVPADPAGNYITLPERVMPAFVRYLNGKTKTGTYVWESAPPQMASVAGSDGKYVKVLVKVEKADHIDRMAKVLLCPAEHLKAWNRLTSGYVPAGQTIAVWRPVPLLSYTRVNMEGAPANRPPAARLEPSVSYWSNIVNKNECSLEVPSQCFAVSTEFVWHILRRNESLDEVARQHGVTAERIQQLNPYTPLKTGSRLKVKPIN